MYNINQSILYKLTSKKKLLKILKLTDSKPVNFFYCKNNYSEFLKVNEFKIKKSDGKFRNIINANKELKKVHKYINIYLSKIETPIYLFSKKRFSNLENAKYHDGNDNVLTLDIKSFFPSCHREYVYRFFSNELKMSNDIAEIMTDLTTLRKKIPQGFSTSNLLAFYSHKNLFDQIDYFCKKNNLKFSLFVDDITISSNKQINAQAVVLKIKAILNSNNLKIKKEKTKYFKRGQHKFITKVCLKENKNIDIPNNLKKEIRKKIELVVPSKYIENSKYLSINGSLNYAKRVNPNSFAKYRSILKTKIIVQHVKIDELKYSPLGCSSWLSYFKIRKNTTGVKCSNISCEKLASTCEKIEKANDIVIIPLCDSCKNIKTEIVVLKEDLLVVHPEVLV